MNNNLKDYSDLKSKTVSSMLWTAVGRFGVLGITFVSNIILARLLTPKDFGCIGILHIFIAVSEVFVIGGFGAALIQKKEVTHIDYTTAFYWNVVVAFFTYTILFFSAPYIADFYSMPLLCDVLRVQSMSLIISAFAIVQSTQLQKNLNFKVFSIRGVIAALIGSIVSVIMAFMGYGVWSLVGQTLAMNFANVLLLWRMSDWRPTLEFSFNSFKILFSFGGLMTLSTLITTIYHDIQGLIIGKWFSPQDMGYYAQARRLEQVPTNALSAIVNQVSFPVFSTINDDKNKLKNNVRKNIKSISYLSIPLCALFIVIAKPLILLLYGSQWEESVFYFRILSLSGMVYVINCIHLSVIKSLGKGRIFIMMQILKRIIGISFIFAGILWGVKGVVIAVVITFYIDLIINCFVNYRLIEYGLKLQLIDIMNMLFLSIGVGLVAYIIGLYLPIHQNAIMAIQVLFFLITYITFSRIFKFEGYYVFKGVVVNLLNKHISKLK
jgi:Membrane protein involved in the export of O-antigen and teichoic acid